MFKKRTGEQNRALDDLRKKTRSALPFALWRDAAYCILILSNVKCVALRVPFSRDILNCVAVAAGRIIACLGEICKKLKIYRTHDMAHVMRRSGSRVLGWKISRNICTFVSVVSCVCVNAFLRNFLFTFLLQCSLITVLWNRFGCLGVVLLHMYVCIFKVIDSSMKLFA